MAEAVNSAFGGWQRRVDAAKSGGPSVSLAKLINDYLNEAHRDNPGTGCAFSALAAEIGRSHERTRALTTEQVRNDIQLIAGLIPDNDPHAARSQAISAPASFTPAFPSRRAACWRHHPSIIASNSAGSGSSTRVRP